MDIYVFSKIRPASGLTVQKTVSSWFFKGIPFFFTDPGGAEGVGIATSLRSSR